MARRRTKSKRRRASASSTRKAWRRKQSRQGLRMSTSGYRKAKRSGRVRARKSTFFKYRRKAHNPGAHLPAATQARYLKAAVKQVGKLIRITNQDSLDPDNTADRRDALKIAMHLRSGNLAQARRLYRQLDFYVRSEARRDIPSLHNLLFY
jgi:hypothetical protein